MGEAYNGVVSICLKKLSNLRYKNGSYARSWKGYLSKRSAVQAFLANVVKTELRGCERTDLQVGQKGSYPLTNWCHFEGFSRSRSGEIRDGNESSAHPEGEGFGVRDSRGSLPHDQESSSPHLEVRIVHCLCSRRLR